MHVNDTSGDGGWDTAPFVKKLPGLMLRSDPCDVITKRFFPSKIDIAVRIAKQVAAIGDAQLPRVVKAVQDKFVARHRGLEPQLRDRAAEVLPRVEGKLSETELAAITGSDQRRFVLGSMFYHEYAIDCAALFNPSIVLAPTQTQQCDDKLECIISLRATGEGHISSCGFRTVLIDKKTGSITLPPRSETPLSTGRAEPSAANDDGSPPEPARLYWNPVTGHEFPISTPNYTVTFDAAATPLDRRVLFPATPSQSNGIEDARFVQFRDGENGGGRDLYYSTFTAYDGTHITPQVVTTYDFEKFQFAPLSGNAITNKGMALFPRKVRGKYWMLSRQDDENVMIMSSDSLLRWDNPQVLMVPEQPWEMFKMGNCGSPLETPRGWLVLTHGVGPMRRYCIGAAMLDREDPTKVVGRMAEPLIVPNEMEREGYVPNVVYSCGGIVHDGVLVLPYAVSDSSSSFATIALDDLYRAMAVPPSKI